MALLTKEVEVGLNGKNLQHYIDLGYEIPRYTNKKGELRYKVGTKIIVKVEDLTDGSHVKLNYACDGCDSILKIRKQEYIARNHNEKYYCQKCYAKIFNSGANNPHYNFDLTDEERECERNYLEYTEFIKRVLTRDNYTCQCCKKKLSGDAEVHHLDGYHWCKERRTDDTNGITLCHNCHFNFHLIYGRGNNTKEQFEEWIGYAIGELEKYNGELPTRRKIYCVEDDCIYDNSDEAIKMLGVTKTEVVRDVCNHKEGHYTVKGKHLFWLDEYEKIPKDDLINYLKNYEPQGVGVICITTGEIYTTITKAIKDKNIKNTSQISDNCRGKGKSAGKLSDGTPLQWMYYNEYLEKIKNGEEIILGKVGTQKVICITTGEIFNSMTRASNIYGLKKVASIYNACNGNAKTAGKLQDGTKLKWMYYEDFLKLPIEEQNEILSKNKDSSSDGSFVMHTN